MRSDAAGTQFIIHQKSPAFWIAACCLCCFLGGSLAAVPACRAASPTAPTRRVDTLRAQAQTALRQGRYPDAERLLRQGMALASGNAANQAAVLNLLGDLCVRRGQYQKAVPVYARAAQNARRAGSRRLQTTALIGQAGANFYLSQYDLALALLHQAQGQAVAAGDKEKQAKVLGGLADVATAQAQYDRARQFCRQGLPLVRASRDCLTEASLLSSFADSYLASGRYEMALPLYQQCLQLAQKGGDRQMAANALTSLGQANTGLNHFERALALYQQSLAMEQAMGAAADVGATTGELGSIYLYLGQYAQAVDCYRAALQAAHTARDEAGAASWLGGMGRAFRYLHRYGDMAACYQKALAISRQTRDRNSEGITLGNLGEAYRLIGQNDKAAEACRKALAIGQQTQSQEVQLWALVHWGELRAAQQAYPDAAAFFQQALLVARSAGVLRAQGYCLSQLMLTAQAQKQDGLAIFYGKQSVNVYQQIRQGLHGLNLNTQAGFLKSKEDTYRRLAELLLDEGRLPEAQQALDLLKRQELFDFLRGGAAGAAQMGGAADLTAAEDVQEKQYAEIADHITALGQQKEALMDKKRQSGALNAADQNALDQANSDLTAANHHLRDYLQQLSTAFAAAPEGGGLQERLQAMKNAAGLQDKLRRLHEQGENVVVLQTIVAPDRCAVIVTTAQSQKVEQTFVSAANLNRKVLALQSALRDPDVDPRRASLAVYRLVVAPIEADLEQAHAQTLMWSLDGALRYIPIAALYDGTRYMAERFDTAVFTLGSLSGFEEDEHANWVGLGMGVSQPAANSGFAPLPSVPEELHSVIRDAGSPQGVVPGVVLLNKAFGQGAMMNALQQQKYNLVHIASHFSLKPGSPDESFLLVGDGSHLSLAQMADSPQIFQGIDLLTLSACDTATTQQDGKEVDSLGTIAQEQGAGAVAATLWPVADASTRLLMASFYRHHVSSSGISKASALRQAQLDLLHGTGAAFPATERGTRVVPSAHAESAPAPFAADPKAPYSHPFFWAPFILIGNWR